MMREVRFLITGQAESALLCRLIGLFAQLGLPAPRMAVNIDGETMQVDARIPGFASHLIAPVSRKMAGFVGVETVTVAPYDEMA